MLADSRGSLVKGITSSRNFGIILVLILMMGALTILSPVFLTVSNLMFVLQQASMFGILACGMTLVIIMGDIDLSVGAILSLSAMFAAELFVAMGVSGILPGIALAVVVGAFCGLLNGILVAQFKLAPFLVTMGMMSIVRGFNGVWTRGMGIRGFPSEWISAWTTGTIPLPIVIFAAVILVVSLIVKYTKYGRYIFAIGGNEQATELSGINIKKVRIITYVIMGVLCSVAAVIYLGRMNSAEATAGIGFEFQAIAAAAIGGASLAGGRGSISGSVLGSLIIAVLANGMTLLGVMAFYQTILTGFIIIVAIMIDKYSTSKA